MNKNRRKKIRPAMGLFGFLGFLGFLGLAFHEPTFFAFFGFFGFFSWLWWGKLGKEDWDERLAANQLRATNKALSICFALVFSGMVISGNLVGSQNPALAYSILIILISVGFATALNLTAYLTWEYDRED